jgi:hypothetical protein
MTNADTTAIVAQSQAGLRRRAPLIINGVAGATVLATLAVGSVLAPVLTGGITLATFLTWLGNLGGNALAGWLNEWAMRNVALFQGDDPNREQKLIEQLAVDLTTQLRWSKELAADTELLVQRTDAIRTVLEALAGQGAQQARLLQLLLSDVQQSRVENNQLHNATYSAIHEQARQILAVQAQSDATVAAQLQAILDAVAKVQSGTTQTINNQAPNQGAQGTFHAPVTFHQQGGISVGGAVGTVQKIDVSGGSVGSIIGSQHNYGAQPPTVSAPPTAAVIENIRAILALQRQTIATYGQIATHGDSTASEMVARARAEVQRLKTQLRGWGQVVSDEPGDER